MSGFYSSSPWSGAGGAAHQIGQSLQKLTSTMAQKNMMQRYQQQQLALRQQEILMRGRLENAQVGTQQAQAGFDNARTSHQQAVDSAARQYQGAAVQRSDGPNFMQGGPSVDNAQQMNLSREIGLRALVRGLGGNVDNPPTATINPGQERINTMTGDSMGYLPPNPTFHAVPAGGTPYILDQGQARVAGLQTGFAPRQMQRPAVPTFHPRSEYGQPVVFDPNSMTLTPIVQGSNSMSLGSPLQLTNMLSKAFNSSPQEPNVTHPQANKPTRQQAADMVQKLGNPQAAIKALQDSGFDTSGYAD